jgi:metallo-beta-lactamase family protein
MCEGGRILHHLRNHVGKPSTTLLFVGYQAQNTLGRRLLEGEKEVRILGEPTRVRARVERADAYSAHADRTGLLEWAEGVRERGRVTRYFLVHGEESAALALADALRSSGTAGVEVPERGAVFELN